MTAADYLTGKHNNQLNVICAEEAGYQLLPLAQNPSQKTWQRNGVTAELPSYTADQNAARSLLALLSDEEWGKFHWEFVLIVGFFDTPLENFRAFMLAAPLQICTAFAVARGRVES